MKTSITSVQLAILETKRARSEKLAHEMDRIHREAQELLEIGEYDGRADDYLSDFLNGCVTAPTAVVLCERIGIEVRS